MRTIFLLLLLPVQSLFAQTNFMPFELERENSTYYQTIIDEQNPTFTSESDALTYYFLAYKLQRSKSPASYFPVPDDYRKSASTYLNINFPNGAALALVHFLESSGSKAATSEILATTSDFKILLPYKFIAAQLSQNQKDSRKALNQMDDAGMLSSVLKNFGRNAVASLGNKNMIVTQGMQDLIAVTYALNENSTVEIQNLFLEQCTSFSGKSVSTITQTSFEKLLVSPVINFTQLGTSENLNLQGIGFAFTSENEDLRNMMSKVGLNFSGLNDIAQSPADSGLIESYRYFATTYLEYCDQFGSKKEKKAATEIDQFVKQAGK